MIAAWLLYASAIGCAIACVALLLERMARWRDLPTRWVWLGAVLAIVALPILLNVFTRASMAPQGIAFSQVAPGGHPSHLVDTSLLILWMGSSLLLIARLVGTARVLRRRRNNWIPFEVNGERVLIADELGPALIGWTKLTTVMPRWAFTLDERSRGLMLQHEAEHARSGDPHLRTVALAALVAMPWNPAIWWCMRRLRLAVEIDCDHRLLAAGVDRHAYASLLLVVGERIAVTPFAWATALAGPRSSLETRIITMMSPFRPRHPRLAIAALGAVIAGIVAIACASPVPESLIPPTTETSKVEPVGRVNVHVDQAFTREDDCTVGSSCSKGPANLILYRKTTRDTAACETGQRCNWTWKTERATGDSIVLLGDSVYVFRESAHDAAIQLKERAGNVEPLQLVNKDPEQRLQLRVERQPWRDSLPTRRP